MSCVSCQSLNTLVYPAELNIHHPGVEGLDKPTVWAFPHLSVCLECGVAQFRLSDDQVRELIETGCPSDAAA
jgi:hypothetical protein